MPDPGAVNIAFNVFDDSWNIPFQQQLLPCIRVLGDTTTQPRLVGASRQTLSMVIYDQTSPGVSSFNVSSGGVTKMLLYGERLFEGSDCCVSNGTPGCDDPDCVDVICPPDPFCCDVEWDQICADAAVNNCGACVVPPPPTVQIEHWGRVEALATTYINDNTLLVEVPNRFRLLPGVAKLWVTTFPGTSETIDLPITYPVPRLDVATIDAEFERAYCT